MNKIYKTCTGTTGAINELFVANDLLIRGFSVFRSLSPSCFCDLIAVHKSGEVFRVEVKTASVDTSGKIRHSKTSNDRFDWLAAVVGNPNDGGKIYYVSKEGLGIFDQDVSNIVLSVSGKKIFCTPL